MKNNHQGGVMIAIICLVIVAAIGAMVAASRSTFGQRCDHLYPNGPALLWERCVERLSRGVQP